MIPEILKAYGVAKHYDMGVSWLGDDAFYVDCFEFEDGSRCLFEVSQQWIDSHGTEARETRWEWMLREVQIAHNARQPHGTGKQHP